jgi:23S rRNA-/tRNA-specific pseudouridylate synthase
MVEAHPETGRHHQIRAHLRSIGTPVLFDRVYGRELAGDLADRAPVSRLALHASRLVVPDATGQGLTRSFEAPLAADLTALLHWLDAEWTMVMAVATSSPG